MRLNPSGTSASLRGCSAGGPWDAKLVTVEGEKLSLNDIEHRILRPIWKDARVHYAVNCASLGCPNLQPAAFTAENMETLLDQAPENMLIIRAAWLLEIGSCAYPASMCGSVETSAAAPMI
jgi:hypothetical protein